MMRVQVTMKSGAQVEFTATEITKARNALGALAKFGWENGDPGQPTLFSIIVDEIAAIVTTDIPSDWVTFPEAPIPPTTQGDPS